jgi:hypothetical protein
MKTPSTGDNDVLTERPAPSREDVPGGGIVTAAVTRAGLTTVNLDKRRASAIQNPKNIEWIRR